MTAVAVQPVRTFQPTQRVVARELRGDRAAAKLDCGHVLDVPANAVSARCGACRPIEALR